MKIFKHPIYCGISGKLGDDGKYKFKVDFENNSDVDVVQFIEPYFYTSSINDNTYWFGYKFNGKLDKKYRDAFLTYLKDIQWAPELNEDNEFEDILYDPDRLSEADLTTMLRRSLNSLDINMYHIDTVIYPLSSTNELVRSIVSCMRGILRNIDSISYVELYKSNPAEIVFDIDRCLDDIESGKLKTLQNIVDREYLENLIDTIHHQNTFSLRDDVHPMALRPYVSNFFEVRKVSKQLEAAANILIVDDVKSSGTTIQEILDIVRQYNNDANVYIFTLLGK